MAFIIMVVGFIILCVVFWWFLTRPPLWRVPEGGDPLKYYFERNSKGFLSRFNPLQLFLIAFGLFLILGGIAAGLLQG